MEKEVKDLKLWDIEFDQVIELLRDFIADWKISKNSDLNEYLKSHSGYFKSDQETKNAIRVILGYAKELMDGKRTEVGFTDNKIWENSAGEAVRMSRFHTRQASELMNEIIKGTTIKN